jgi:putative flippase GtrA
MFNLYTSGRLIFDSPITIVCAVRFSGMYFFLWFLNLCFLWVLVDIQDISAYWAGLVWLPVGIIFSFLLQRYWVFKPL